MKYLGIIIVLSINIGCMNTNKESFSNMAKKMANSFDSKSIEINEDTMGSYTFLDAREYSEYRVSHLKGAIHVGYNNFDLDKVSQKLSKSKKYIVYCSVGYRSGDIAMRLSNKGFDAINLYGGLFGWKNRGNAVFSNNQVTNKVHGYNKKWSRYLESSEVVLND